MLTTIMKWASLFVLMGGIFLWAPATNYELLLRFVICGSAALVALEAARSGKRLWTATFAGLVAFFNPVMPVALSDSIFPWVTAFCFSMFLASLVYLKPVPMLSVESITSPGPRSQSL